MRANPEPTFRSKGTKLNFPASPSTSIKNLIPYILNNVRRFSSWYFADLKVTSQLYFSILEILSNKLKFFSKYCKLYTENSTLELSKHLDYPFFGMYIEDDSNP